MLGAMNFITTILNMRAPGWKDSPFYKTLQLRVVSFMNNKLTVCWNMLLLSFTLWVTINLMQEPAGNQNLEFGFPRDYMLAITSISMIKVKTSKQLGYYLAGLTEGDGYIGTPSTTSKVKPNVTITFNLKDLTLAKKLSETIGFGNIRIQEKYNACRLTISNTESLIKYVELVNGKFRTPKIYALHNLINWLNENRNTSIQTLPIDKSKFNDNAWLAGFSDADSNFDIRVTDKSLNSVTDKLTKARVALRFRIEQQSSIPNVNLTYHPIISDLATYFNVNLATREYKSGKYNYILVVNTFEKVPIVINYFNSFPLMSSKYLDYQDWKEVYDMILTKDHLTEDGRIKIKFIKMKMNDNRVSISWDHLNNFYN